MAIRVVEDSSTKRHAMTLIQYGFEPRKRERGTGKNRARTAPKSFASQLSYVVARRSGRETRNEFVLQQEVARVLSRGAQLYVMLRLRFHSQRSGTSACCCCTFVLPAWGKQMK